MSSRKLNYIFAGMVGLAMAFLMLQCDAETKQIPTVSEAVVNSEKTIAVLPFIDLSPARDQELFVDGFSEEVINRLTQIPDLIVAERTSSFSFKDSNKTLQEIANILGVKYLLEGSVTVYLY